MGVLYNGFQRKINNDKDTYILFIHIKYTLLCNRQILIEVLNEILFENEIEENQNFKYLFNVMYILLVIIIIIRSYF